jgi:hypothetical protein
MLHGVIQAEEQHLVERLIARATSTPLSGEAIDLSIAVLRQPAWRDVARKRDLPASCEHRVVGELAPF